MTNGGAPRVLMPPVAPSFFVRYRLFLSLILGVLLIASASAITYPVVYLPTIPTETPEVEGIAPAVEPDTIELIFVGDIMLSRGIGNSMVHAGDWRYPFLNIAEYLRSADLTIGNLESPISSRGTKIGSIYSFRADPRAIEGLGYAGIDVLSLANNHIWDYGPEAFEDTLTLLKEHGIDYVGAGLSYEEAHQAVVREVKGTRFAFLAYTNLLPHSLGLKNANHAVAFSQEVAMREDIRQASEIADIVIVQFHWGEEYETLHNSYQENLGHIAIDAGADLVVGHHPHVAQEIEKYDTGFIAYSLGNFVFDQNFSEDTRSGLVLQVTLKDKEIEEVTSEKVTFNASYQPILNRGSFGF